MNTSKRRNIQYDIIADIHGHADKLEDLLLKLGYAMQNGIYRHHERKAVLSGIIDRGTQNQRVLEQFSCGYDNEATKGFLENKPPDDAKIPWYDKEEKPVFFGHY